MLIVKNGVYSNLTINKQVFNTIRQHRQGTALTGTLGKRGMIIKNKHK